MGSDGRSRLPVEQRRAQLLTLGQRLFSERPFGEISVDEIAEAAGISKGLLYHYFPSKRELYIACVRCAAQAIVDASDPPRELAPKQRLAASLDAFMDHVEANFLSFAYLLQGGANGDPDLDRVLMDMRKGFIDRTARDLGIDRPSTSTRMCLLGYVGFASYTCMTWARAPRVGRKAIRHMLFRALGSAVETAMDLAEGPERQRLSNALTLFEQ